MNIPDELIETIRNMMVDTEMSIDMKYSEGYNDALDAVVETMEALAEGQQECDALEPE